MAWEFDESGIFDEEADADKWARHNGYDTADFRTRRTSRGVELELRRNARDDGKPDDRNFGRRTGF